MTDIEELPDLRTEAELVAAARELAARCAEDQPADQAAAMLDQGLSIMLELRVPRMPNDDADLARMIDEARSGPTYSMDEVMDHLRSSGAAFSLFLERFRQEVARESWTSAATMLLPSRSAGAPAWEGPPVRNRIALTDAGSGTTTLTRDGATVECRSPIGGLSILGAVMLAHAEWRDVWRR